MCLRMMCVQNVLKPTCQARAELPKGVLLSLHHLLPTMLDRQGMPSCFALTHRHCIRNNAMEHVYSMCCASLATSCSICHDALRRLAVHSCTDIAR